MTTDANTQSHNPPSYWKVGLVLLGIVVAALAGAFLLNQQMRPHVGVAPAVTAPGTATPHLTPGQRGQTSRSTPRPAIVPATRGTGSPTARPVPTPTPGEALMQAYHRYWQQYGQALYTLDTSHMDQVATGIELRRVQAEVGALRQEKRAVRVRVRHAALIVALKGNTATLYDEQRDQSFLIDPKTKEPHHGSNQTVVEKDIYYLQKIHGTWKVVKSLRER